MLGPTRVSGGPTVWAQEYVRSPAAKEAELVVAPASLSDTPGRSAWSAPAFATGTALAVVSGGLLTGAHDAAGGGVVESKECQYMITRWKNDFHTR